MELISAFDQQETVLDPPTGFLLLTEPNYSLLSSATETYRLNVKLDLHETEKEISEY